MTVTTLNHEGEIFNQNNASQLTTFQRNATSGLFNISNHFSPPASRFEARPLLIRLVKTEIVSAYHGILINTAMGNPTVPSITASGERAGSTRQVGRCKKAFTVSIKR